MAAPAAAVPPRGAWRCWRMPLPAGDKTWAARMGSHREEHFIFCYQVNKARWDPNRPASKSWLRNQTGKLRERADLPNLRPHLWRHQIATEMLEAGKPRDSVIAVCGWVSEKRSRPTAIRASRPSRTPSALFQT